MSIPKMDLPMAHPVMRPNGDVHLDLVHRGQTVGYLNVTQVVSGLFKRMGLFQPPGGTS